MSGPRLLCVPLGCCLALILASSAAWAQSTAPGPSPLAYRRVFVPEDSINEQIRGLLPLDRSEFERRLLLADKLNTATLRLADVRLEAATFQARYEQGQLLDGKAALNITLASAGPAMLALSPFSGAIETARWQG